MAVAALAREDLPRLAAAAGPAPAGARRQLLDTFGRVPHNALRELVGFAGDGNPLGRLFAELAPMNVNSVRDALAFGVSTGRPARLIARDVQQASGAALHRAMTITSTEVIRAHRSISRDLMRQSPVVTGWTWYAHPDARTCPVCWAMHGTVHPKTETLDSHPNCRCTMVPRTASWEQLGFAGISDRRPTIPSGAALFARLSAGQQREGLGPTRYRLYRQGAIDLRDFVRPTHSPRWGPGLRQANVSELRTA